MTGRIDRASRTIRAAPDTLYGAFIDPDAQLRWLPPPGMRGIFERFEPWPDGRYRLILTYAQAGHGKSRADADIVNGRFVELVPGKRIVQTADFESGDPAFAGTMTMTWTFEPGCGGTEVTITASDVPPEISADDHAAGLNATLANLAAFAETPL